MSPHFFYRWQFASSVLFFWNNQAAKRESIFLCVSIFSFDLTSPPWWDGGKWLSIYKTCATCNGKSEKSEIIDKLSVVLVTDKGLCDTNVICFVCCRNTETVAACWEVHTDEIRSKIPVNFAFNQNVDA